VFKINDLFGLDLIDLFQFQFTAHTDEALCLTVLEELPLGGIECSISIAVHDEIAVLEVACS
jgi:hypothetical protein